MRDGIVVEPLANPDGTPFEYDPSDPPRGFVLGMKCFNCGRESRFIPKVANSRMHKQPNPPSTMKLARFRG
jgi:hypothetical protein